MENQIKSVKESVAKRVEYLEKSSGELMKLHANWLMIDYEDPNVVKYSYILFAFADYDILDYVEATVISQKSRNIELMTMGSMTMIKEVALPDFKNQQETVVSCIKERMSFLQRKSLWQKSIMKKYDMIDIENSDIMMSLLKVFASKKEEDVLAFEMVVLHPWFLPFEPKNPLENFTMEKGLLYTLVQVGDLTFRKPVGSLPVFEFRKNDIFTDEESGRAFESHEGAIRNLVDETTMLEKLLSVNRAYEDVFEYLGDKYKIDLRKTIQLPDKSRFTCRLREEEIIKICEKDENMLTRLSVIRYLSGPQFIDTVSKQGEAVIKELVARRAAKDKSQQEQQKQPEQPQ